MPPRKVKLSDEMLHAIEQAAERAARRATARALKQFLLALGINAETPEGLIEGQKDAAFTRRVRLASESAPARYGAVIVGGLFTILGAIIAITVKHIMGW